MNTKKLILTAALIGTVALSAQAGVRVGISVGVPAPVVVAPAPVVVNPPVYPAPAPEVAVPVSPGPDYIWVPGYWSVGVGGRVWVPGVWQHHGYYGHDWDHYYDRDGWHHR